MTVVSRGDADSINKHIIFETNHSLQFENDFSKISNAYLKMLQRFALNVIGKRCYCRYAQEAKPLRSVKSKSQRDTAQNFVDLKLINAIGGKGGDGCISFLSLWSNEFAGPDGGDGGHGGHVILRSSEHTKDLSHLSTVIRADNGEKGYNKDCNGKNAQHNVIDVPVGTIIKNRDGVVIGDLHKEGLMFVAARGGAGGRGNHFFTSDTQQVPKICEYGAEGENVKYTIELRSIAEVGLIGLPNAGKSTLLRAISRAKPKVAPYPFTTLRPHIGIVQYTNYEQIAVADLPGLIEDSHKNRGLGIQFLRHIERCKLLLFVIDISVGEPWDQYRLLRHELTEFNKNLIERRKMLVANKIDLLDAELLQETMDELKKNVDCDVIMPVSAKNGNNLNDLLIEIKRMSDMEQ